MANQEIRGHIVNLGVKKQKDGDKFIEIKARLKHSKANLSALGELIETECDFTFDPIQTEMPGIRKAAGE